MTETCCPCDVLIHPTKPKIIAGLDALPRQLAGFPEFRNAMLRDIRAYEPLEAWTAREGDDRGLMLFEMWAYVLDILGFYDERIANEAYLRTAVHRSSLRRLVELIGYHPRPGHAASVVLAAIAEGHEPLLLPAGTGFRSGAFNGEAPQVFETTSDILIEEKRNRWQLAPIRSKAIGKNLLFDVGSIGIDVGSLVLFQWRVSSSGTLTSRGTVRYRIGALGGRDGGPFALALSDGISGSLFERINSEIERRTGVAAEFEIPRSEVAGATRVSVRKMAVGRVTALDEVQGRDGQTYTRANIGPHPTFERGVRIDGISTLTPSETASLNGFAAASVTPTGASSRLILDAVYPALTVGNPVIVEHGTQLRAASVTGSRSVTQAMGSGTDTPVVPVTSVDIRPRLPAEWASNIRLHFNMVDSGRLTNVAATHLSLSDVDGAAIAPPVEAPNLGSPGSFLLHDAERRGESVDGELVIDGSDPLGMARLSLNDSETEFDRALRTPVDVYGNLVVATRGESVRNEILGSGNAAQAFQQFALGKKSLTYLAEPSAPNGRRSTLEIRVNGVRWRERPSFFGAGSEDEIFVVRQKDDHESIITFGDGRTGARLPTGVDNVVANYRHGVGAASPPANSITQLFRPVAGLSRVRNPVAAGGGRDPDKAEDLRENAPASALTLGRAISLPDFEALAYDFGVINTHASWAWDNTSQRAVVKIWYIATGGDIQEELRNYLLGQSDPNVPLSVCEAQPSESRLQIDLEIDGRFESDAVEAAVIKALSNPDTGLLALENIPIGCPIFRSQLFLQILSVEGVISVRSMLLDGRPAPGVIGVHDGKYRSFLHQLVVGNSAAGDIFAAPARLSLQPIPRFARRAIRSAAMLRTDV